MSRIIIFFGYNNYYNRIIKKDFDNIDDYLTFSIAQRIRFPSIALENINFDYQDDVYSEIVVNLVKAKDYLDYRQPDYCVLEGPERVLSPISPGPKIKPLTRWFVLKSVKTRGYQFRLYLRRDVVADYYTNILQAPAFIEKGTPTGADDPAIFNNENFTFNQIKQGEMLLNNTVYSGNKGGWIVGYLARKKNDEMTDIEIKAEANTPSLVTPYNNLPALVQGLVGSLPRFDNSEKIAVYPNDFDLSFFFGGMFISGYYKLSDNGTDTIFKGANTNGYGNMNAMLFAANPSSSVAINDFLDNYLDFNSQLITALNNVTLPAEYMGYTTYDSSILAWNNKLFSKDGKTYAIRIGKYSVEGEGSWDNILLPGTTYTNAQVAQGIDAVAVVLKAFATAFGSDLSSPIRYNSEYGSSNNFTTINRSAGKCYYAYVEEYLFSPIKATIDKDRQQNFEAPYDLVCIPFGEIDVVSGGTTLFTTVPNVALAIARGISVYGGSNVYDLQILPYAPFDAFYNSNGKIDITSKTEGKDFDYIKLDDGDTEPNVGIMLYPTHCRGTFDLELDSSNPLISYFEPEYDIVEKKVKSETTLCRFVSPNFASTFEINIQKNNGINLLNVDYFLKPYVPYIHVAPYFDGFYGLDFNDPKGLVCSGDFSITATTSQWEEYQVQNKNYELIFNRQLENLDINNKITYEQQRISSGIGVATSTLTGAGAGAVAGSYAGAGPSGALLGAAGGLVTSQIGRYYDLKYLREQQLEARSFMYDMYSANLGNIKALPYSLTRITSLTENNKLFPFIEIYDCTDTEKQALRDKLKYNGFTIMRIGKIEDFISTDEPSYVQAQLIRLVDVDVSSEVLTEINDELKKGVFIKNYGSSSE